MLLQRSAEVKRLGPIQEQTKQALQFRRQSLAMGHFANYEPASHRPTSSPDAERVRLMVRRGFCTLTGLRRTSARHAPQPVEENDDDESEDENEGNENDEDEFVEDEDDEYEGSGVEEGNLAAEYSELMGGRSLERLPPAVPWRSITMDPTPPGRNRGIAVLGRGRVPRIRYLGADCVFSSSEQPWMDVRAAAVVQLGGGLPTSGASCHLTLAYSASLHIAVAFNENDRQCTSENLTAVRRLSNVRLRSASSRLTKYGRRDIRGPTGAIGRPGCAKRNLILNNHTRHDLTTVRRDRSRPHSISFARTAIHEGYNSALDPVVSLVSVRYPP